MKIENKPKEINKRQCYVQSNEWANLFGFFMPIFIFKLNASYMYTPSLSACLSLYFYRYV